MDNPLTYQNIATPLKKFIELCGIISDHDNKEHDASDMTKIMTGAAALTASAGGYAEGKRKATGTSGGDEWVRKAFARADPETVQNAFDEIIEYQLNQLKKLKNDNTPITMAFDKHLIPRYDKNPGPELLRSKSKKGTWKFEGYITAQCVDPGLRMTLAAYPIGAGESTADFVRKIVYKCQSFGIPIKCVLMDREFFAVETLDAMDKAKQTYMTPCKNTHNVVTALDEFDAKVRDGKSECILENHNKAVKYIMMIVKRTARKCKHGKSCQDCKPEKPSEKYIGFAANSNELDVAAYMKRWGIETGYRMIEDLRVKTRSTRPGARLLCFTASIILYNQWVVINAESGFGLNDSKWYGISFVTLEFKIAMIYEYQINPKPPPDITADSALLVG